MTENEQDAFLIRIVAYQDGTLAAAELREFETALLNDAERRSLFIELQYRSAAIAELFREKAFAIDAPVSTRPVANPRAIRNHRIWLAASALALAAAITWFMVFPFAATWNRDAAGQARSPFATITYASHTVWSGDSSAGIAAGAKLIPHVSYQLSSGSIRLRMMGGAIVSLAAPATFTGIGPTELKLKAGKLTARLPDQRSKLVVRAGEMIVRDIGTAFGITASADGDVDLSVFDGSVAIRYAHDGHDARQEQTLGEGKTIVSIGGTNESHEVPYAPEQYQDIWPLTIGVDEASALIEFVRPGPRDSLEQFANDFKLLLIPEQLNQWTKQPVYMKLLQPGQSWPESRGKPISLSPKRTISSYLVVYLPKDRETAPRHSISGSISFQHRILGVALTDYQLSKTDKLFGIPEIDYDALPMRYLEDETTEEGHLPADSLRVSDDGKHLYFNFYVGAGQDHIRVLIDEGPATANKTRASSR